MPDADQLARVHALGSPIIETPVVGLDGHGTGRLRRVRLDNGETLDRDALFFYVGWRLRKRRRPHAGLPAARRRLHRRRFRPSDDRRPRLRRRQLRRTAARVPAAAGSGVTAPVAINARLSFEDADRAVADSRAPARASEVR